MAKLGSQGVNITKIYATSETVMGIEMAHSAKMGIFVGGRFRSIWMWKRQICHWCSPTSARLLHGDKSLAAHQS
jgi:hypothetical protein